MEIINKNPKVLFWADLHIGHHNIYNAPFLSVHDNTKPMRPFKTSQEADEYMIAQYNKVVGPNDKVYFLGDIAMGKKNLAKLAEMKPGYKYLIMGNHDTQAPIEEYSRYFNKIYGVLYMKWAKAIITHVPVHPWSMYKFDYNFHGHLHDHEVPDERYINFSVEHTGYKPVTLEEMDIYV